MNIARDVVVDSVPLVDLGWQHQQIADEIGDGFQQVMAKTAFIGGAIVSTFEAAFAKYCGVNHCIGVANGTDAIELCLRALGIGVGDEVILPTNSFVATAEAVVRAGASPVLVDADPGALLIDPAAVAAAITPSTAAIIPVHLYGQIAPMQEILDIARKHGLAVVEDAAQAQGATQNGAGIGTFGRAASTSFYPGKNLGAYGDAGACLTGDAELDQMMRRIGNHGSSVKYVHDVFGFNCRMDAFQAVVLEAKLRRLDGWNAMRRSAAARYDELLRDVEGVVLPITAPGNEHVWHIYAVRVADRDRVLADVNAAGIGAGIHYPVPIHAQPAFSRFAGDEKYLVSDAAASSMISLPMFPGITHGQQERVVDALLTALRR
jgi:dTDP-4-amino-4,6-dideoxygalactose transaminase